MRKEDREFVCEAIDDLREAVALVAEALGTHRMVGGQGTWDAIADALKRVGDAQEALKKEAPGMNVVVK